VSLLLNGNNISSTSTAFKVTDPTVVGEVRRFGNALCESLNFDETRAGRVGIIINEFGTNLSKYGKEGQLLIRVIEELGLKGVEILSIDKGPGFDPDVVLVDGFSSGGTQGTGLGSIKRQSDVFDFYSSPTGSVLVARIYEQPPSRNNSGNYSVGAVSVPVNGETLCGDGWSVKENGGTFSVCVVDGLGHGPAANTVAVTTADTFLNSDPMSSDTMLLKIHNRLKSTRGGAIFIAHLKANEIEFLGAGNIRAVIQEPGRYKSLISHNGTAGVQIRNHRPLIQAWSQSDPVIFISDGINSRWDLELYPGIRFKHPSIIAGIIYRDFSRGTDDTTVVVVKANT
jgi:Anti-sigma regulatory factor (Ser/Thr protein kinase)